MIPRRPTDMGFFSDGASNAGITVGVRIQRRGLSSNADMRFTAPYFTTAIPLEPTGTLGVGWYRGTVQGERHFLYETALQNVSQYTPEDVDIPLYPSYDIPVGVPVSSTGPRVAQGFRRPPSRYHPYNRR